MVKVREEDLRFIKKYLPNWEELLKSEDVNDILEELNYLQVDNMEGDSYTPNDICTRAERVYDNIYYDND